MKKDWGGSNKTESWFQKLHPLIKSWDCKTCLLWQKQRWWLFKQAKKSLDRRASAKLRRPEIVAAEAPAVKPRLKIQSLESGWRLRMQGSTLVGRTSFMPSLSDLDQQFVPSFRFFLLKLRFLKHICIFKTLHHPLLSCGTLSLTSVLLRSCTRGERRVRIWFSLASAICS